MTQQLGQPTQIASNFVDKALFGKVRVNHITEPVIFVDSIALKADKSTPVAPSAATFAGIDPDRRQFEREEPGT